MPACPPLPHHLPFPYLFSLPFMFRLALSPFVNVAGCRSQAGARVDGRLGYTTANSGVYHFLPYRRHIRGIGPDDRQQEFLRQQLLRRRRLRQHRRQQQQQRRQQQQQRQHGRIVFRRFEGDYADPATRKACSGYLLCVVLGSGFGKTQGSLGQRGASAASSRTAARARGRARGRASCLARGPCLWK